MSKIMYVLLALCLLCLFSCQKIEVADIDEPKDDKQSSFADIDVPSNFDWNVYKQVEVEVEIADQYSGNLYYGIEIYDGIKLLDKGFVKGNEVFKTVVSVEKLTSDLIIQQIDPNGDRVMDGVAINGNRLVLDFDAKKDKPWLSSKSVAFAGSNIVIPEDAIVMYNNTVLEVGKSYVVNTYVSKINSIKGVDLYITTNGIFNFNPEAECDNSNIYVCPGGRLVGKTFDTFTNVNLYNYGEVNVYGDFVFDGGSFINHSEVFLYNLTLNRTTLETHGLLMVGTRIPSDEDKVIDYTKVGVFKMTNSTVTIAANALLKAKSVKATGGKIILESHAWLWADDDDNKDYDGNVVEFEGTKVSVIGSDKYALVLADELFVDKNNVVGPIVLDVKKINGKKINSGDSWGADIILGSGSGKISITNSHYSILKYDDGGYKGTAPDPLPIPNEVVYFEPVYTIVMEDSYPSLGDMDMNDIVCTWQLGMQKNEENKVSKIGLKYTIKSLGGTRKIAGAVALRGLVRNNIKTVTLPAKNSESLEQYFKLDRFKLEVGNSDVVIPLFEDAHKTFFNITTPTFVNAFMGSPIKESVSFEVEVEFKNPIDQGEITRDMFDFFVVMSGDMNKRTEIHLYGNSPTAKASNLNEDFKNNKTIWGLELTDDFAYPQEMKMINIAYPKFKPWVESGGSTNQDWFKYPDDSCVWKAF